MGILYDYLALDKLPLKQRYESCYNILKNDRDESLRVEALWAVGNLLEQSPDDSLKEKIENILVDVLKNDENAIVRHEAAYQLGEHEVLGKLPDLIDAILNDPNEVVRHESIEGVGLMRKTDAIKDIEPALKDHNESVRQTAQLVIKQLQRLEKLQAAKTA
ncbi:MAG: HEAT repeat domain-containing protein [Candidatus Nitrosotenuis sp.]